MARNEHISASSNCAEFQKYKNVHLQIVFSLVFYKCGGISLSSYIPHFYIRRICAFCIQITQLHRIKLPNQFAIPRPNCFHQSVNISFRCWDMMTSVKSDGIDHCIFSRCLWNVSKKCERDHVRELSTAAHAMERNAWMSLVSRQPHYARADRKARVVANSTTWSAPFDDDETARTRLRQQPIHPLELPWSIAQHEDL